MASWNFITNHGVVLAVIAQHGQITAREIAEYLGMTERPVRRIIADLEAAGYLYKHRTGRVNHYQVNVDLPLRRPIAQETTVGDLLHALKLAARRIK
jgi:DeoR/GlpR family transcriptional regulator of sugar metabolism